MKLTEGGQTLVEGENPKRHLPLLFVVAMIPLSYTFKKFFGASNLRITMYTDDIKIFVKNEKGQEALTQTIRI